MICTQLMIMTTSDNSDCILILSPIHRLLGKELPFYGTQWHPEKNAFEWSKQRNIAHSKDAVKAAQYVADFFVNESRKSTHRFKSVELEEKYLIYNYNPINTAASGHFEQCYVF